MNEQLKLSLLQVWRTRLHLFLAGIRRRMTVGVRAVLIDGQKVLLVRHTYMPGWQFPGGGVEPFETAELSAAREVMEETGYAVDGRPRLLGLYLNRIAGGGRDHVAVYVWHAFRAQVQFAPNMEIAACEWFDIDALPAETDPGTRRRIDEIFRAAQPGAEW